VPGGITGPPSSWGIKGPVTPNLWEFQMIDRIMVTDHMRHEPLSNSTTNYRPGFSSERAPFMRKKQSNCQI
jgi:hypothetical protein